MLIKQKHACDMLIHMDQLRKKNWKRNYEFVNIKTAVKYNTVNNFCNIVKTTDHVA